MFADGEYHPDGSDTKRPLQPHMYPRIAIGSPSEERPMTPGGDAVSDELSFAKWRSKDTPKTPKKNKNKSSRLRESIYSGADSPGSAFAETVNKNTGFSPLNPTKPLQDAFHSTLSPPPAPKPVLMVQTPAPSPPPRREFLLDPTRASAERESPPVSAKPRTPSPLSETPIRPSFASVRPQLFQKAFLDSIRGVPFDDTNIYLCSARSKGGIVHKPQSVHARNDFLCAASSVFAEELLGRYSIDPSAVSERRSSRIEYGYDYDSDLEECEEDRPQKPQAPPKTQTFSSPRPPLSRASTTSIDSQATPKSAALSSTDIDVVSLDDFNSVLGLSDDSSDSSRAKDAQRRPSLSVETSVVSVLSWRDDHMKDTAIPIKKVEQQQPEEIKLPPSPEETILVKYQTGERQSKTLFIPGSAHRTWQALLLYLYNDVLEFAPLRSQQRDSGRAAAGAVATSPKSMYRLAAKLGLEQLKDKAFCALRDALSKENVVEELFSDFTWRYPEVLQMETEVFHRYAAEGSVQTALSEKFQEIAYGQLPHSSTVLSSLFKKFVGVPAGSTRK